MAVLTALTFLMSLFIKRSNPPTPPSASNETHASDAPPFRASINMCFRNKQFIIQMFTFALAFAELWGFMVIMPDILTEQGYNLQGYPTALCALVGVLASLIAGAVADKKKNFKELIRICWVFLTISIIFTRIWLRKQCIGPSDSIVVMLACAAMGAFSIPQFPIGVEMGVETTFPVYEATASGILVLSGCASSQLWMFILYGVFELTKRIDIIYDYDKKSSTGNWQLVLDMWCALAIISTIISFFMNPIYKRLQCENNIKQQFKEDGGESIEPTQFINDGSGRDDTEDKDLESGMHTEARDYRCIGTKDS
uniref:MFS domain-containing protein n=1 Tax=Heterorhabditis bacteriophora TaxID=37862 RepID=A0A1I7XLH1_HETBA